ncbi:MAG TPA: condensation domain-containing protein, partial [Candidatus Cryosericum sp.]|nr:condensation domain-containing protein [Candidatus Cryosericum sp.]
MEQASGLSPEKQELIELLLQEVAPPEEPPASLSAPGSPRLPLSSGQQRLWFLTQLNPDDPAYNESGLLRLKGLLDVRALERTLDEIVRRHAILRTTFPVVDGRPVQVVAAASPLSLDLVDLGGHAAESQGDLVLRLAQEEARRPFDLAQGPLFRARLVRLDDEDHALLLVMHHIICDGWSTRVLSREMAVLYDAFVAGRPSPLPDLPIQYADFAVWQQEWLRGGNLARQLEYWRSQLADLPTLELPTDRPRPFDSSFRGAEGQRALGPEVSDALRRLSTSEGVTLFMTLLSAFSLLLSRYSGQEDVVVGTPIAGRNRAEFEGLIGFFLNTLVLRNDLSGDPTFRKLLKQTRTMALDAYGHQDVPFERLVEELRPERDLRRTPLFQVMFNLLGTEEGRFELRGLTVDVTRYAPPDASKFDLTLYAEERGEGIGLRLVYNADLFERGRMEGLLDQLEHLLGQVVGDPDRAVSSYSLVTSQAGLVLPDPVAALPEEEREPVQVRFSRQAAAHPGREA